MTQFLKLIAIMVWVTFFVVLGIVIILPFAIWIILMVIYFLNPSDFGLILILIWSIVTWRIYNCKYYRNA